MNFSTIVLLISAYIIFKNKGIFGVAKNKKLMLVALAIVLLSSFIGYEHISNGYRSITAGVPYVWVKQYVNNTSAHLPKIVAMNIFNIQDTAYRIDLFMLNLVVFYCFLYITPLRKYLSSSEVDNVIK